jgi:hypothetical protein
MSDLICEQLLFDQSVFGPLTSNDLLNFKASDLEPFLCDLMNLVGLDNIDPILFENNQFTLNNLYNPVSGINFDLMKIDVEGLMNVGDPRIPYGQVIKTVMNEFFPIALVQVELIQSGGCQVVENYICDSDGNRIKKLEIQCPPNILNRSLTSNDIISRTQEIVTTTIENHAIDFSNQLKQKIKEGWTVSLHFYKNFFIFYVKLVKDNRKEYIKYYQDSRNIVSRETGLLIQLREDNQFDDENHYKVISTF